MNNMQKFNYFSAGLGLGAAVGILLAPKSGADTRYQIRAKAGDSVDYARRRAEDLRDGLRGTFEEARDVIRDTPDRVAAAADAGRRAYRETVRNVPEGAPSLAGVLIEAAVLLGVYKTTRLISKHIEGVRPKVEELLDTSSATISRGGGRFAEITEKAGDFLDSALRQLGRAEEFLETAARARSTARP
jgi:gas vesicle protein